VPARGAGVPGSDLEEPPPDRAEAGAGPEEDDFLAAVVVVVRGRRRARAVASLALVVALAVYAGQPDALVLMGTAVAVFALALLVRRVRGLGGAGPILRPLLDLAAGVGAGAALGAPLLLPGAQLIARSARGAKGGSQGLPVRDLMYLVFQGFDGSPVGNWFGSSFYVRTAAYVGVIGVALAVVGVAASTGRARRRPEVVAVAAVAVIGIAQVVMPPIVLGSVQWHRALLVVDLALAVLAGLGLDAIVRGRERGRLRAWATGSFAALGLIVALVFAFGRGHLTPARATLRAQSFWWPAAETVLGLVVMGALTLADRRRGPAVARPYRAGRWAAIVLFACEAAFLAASGAPLIPSSPRFLAPTAAEQTLLSTVGSSLVGLGQSTCFTSAQLGTVPEVGDAFGLHEFAAYDPLLPYSYDSAWVSQTSQQPLERPVGSLVPFSLFCPAVTTVAEARRYGVAYVLEPAGTVAPAGFVAVRSIADETLFRVPGASAVTLVPAPSPATMPGLDAAGTSPPATGVDSDAWRVVTAAPVRSVLRVRLTDVPGWHATIDGRPLSLERYAGVMLQAVVPAGHHVIELDYRPGAFTLGLALAVVALLALAGVPIGVRLRRRGRHRVRPRRRERRAVLSVPPR